MTLYDEDKHTKDDLIGEVTLSVDDLIKPDVVATQTANLSKKGELSYSATVKTVFEKSVAAFEKSLCFRCHSFFEIVFVFVV